MADMKTSQISRFQYQDEKFPELSPIRVRVRELSPLSPFRSPATAAEIFTQKLFCVLFFSHLILITVLVVYLDVRNVVESGEQKRRDHFRVKEWYLQLMAATGCGGVFAFVWQWFSFRYPSQALKIIFFVCPLLVFSVASLFLLFGTLTDLGVAVLAVIFALTQGFYTCWVHSRFEYAAKILSVSMAFLDKTIIMVLGSIVVGIAYCALLLSGIAAATASGTRIDILFIFLILASLVWSTHVIKNISVVAVSRIRYVEFAGAMLKRRIAIREALRYQIGSICIGSVLAPIFTVLRGSSRGVNMFGCSADEMLGCFADCCSGIASKLIKYGNRWGFVLVGVNNKRFTQASRDTWEMFKRVQLIALIDTDLTSSFCFLSGVAGGAICTLVAGSWALAVHQSHATELAIYTFLIGYFMVQVAMACIQACVSAYYVAYAENPTSPLLDPTIRDHLAQLQRHRSLSGQK